MAQTLPAKRTTSISGFSRLALSVGKTPSPQAPGAGRHPLKQNWAISYVQREPGAKDFPYAEEIRRIATFGSIESFLHLYAHLTPPSELPLVTDLLIFASRIAKPGVWEELPSGGKFSIRIVKAVSHLLYETLIFSLIGDQFEESDSVVGCVLSVRPGEDILTVWVEEESDAVRSGALRERILSQLSLPTSTACEYRSSKALLDASTNNNVEHHPQPSHQHPHPNQHQQHNRSNHAHNNDRERGPRDGYSRRDDHTGRNGWGNGARRDGV
ncbi:translation initiation factor 4E, partial [Tremellales sp. Uapishka_1]